MNQVETKQQLIKKLVDELLKNSVNQKQVKELSEKLKIPYSSDLEIQMTNVLMNQKIWNHKEMEA